jgi:hypothetical protein
MDRSICIASPFRASAFAPFAVGENGIAIEHAAQSIGASLDAQFGLPLLRFHSNARSAGALEGVD